ncbi:histone-lysine N-methyltransferase SETMAR [Trichonephila clavipes]|nr:histone-lysine N-methyltransferase SETMAR [Trichonephila clavipes]
MEINKEKIRYTLHFSLIKAKKASQAAEIVHSVYIAEPGTANYVQFCFRRFRSDISDVNDAPSTGRPVIEKVDKISEIIKVDWHVSRLSIAQELKINHKTVSNNLRKVDSKRNSMFGCHTN